MGSSLSWIAVKGRSNEELQQILGFKATGQRGDYGKHPLVGRQLPDGWYILIANTCDDRITKSKTLTQLSKGCQVVACSVEEHVMFSSCAFWNKGKRVWSVKHRGEQSVFDIANSGKLPEGYFLLKNELIEKQKAEGGEKADADYVFELPLEMAKQLVGFKHDEEITRVADGPYEVYELNFLQRASRVIASSIPWLYIVGVLVIFGFFMIVVGDLARDLINGLIQFVKGFLP